MSVTEGLGNRRGLIRFGEEMAEEIDVYVVVREGWQYNDEYYYRTGDGEGWPTGVYLTEEAAKKAAGKADFDEFFEYANYRRKKGVSYDLKDIHQFGIMEALDYDYEDKENWTYAISELLRNDPSIFEGEHDPETISYDWQNEDQFRLTRPMTEEEIRKFMADSSVGSHNVCKTRMIQR